MADAQAMIERAARIADEVLWPQALAVDVADRVPSGHLDLLAAEGFYGVARDLGVADLATAGAILEAFAGGCLATAFVWLQHHGPLIATMVSAQPGLRERWVAPLSKGEIRAGIALAGLAPAADLRVERSAEGYRLTGEIPWVTGWDLIDVVQVGARDDAGDIHFLLVDATAGPTLQVGPLHLVAAQASRTVTLRFTGHPVPADRLTGTQPYADWSRANAAGSALNGFLAIGVAARCCRLLGPGPLDAEVDECRAALLRADSRSTPAARAAASEVAYRAAEALAVHVGSRAVLSGNPAQMLAREAMFLLVFGSRPAIKAELAARISRPGRSAGR